MCVADHFLPIKHNFDYDRSAVWISINSKVSESLLLFPEFVQGDRRWKLRIMFVISKSLDNECQAQMKHLLNLSFGHHDNIHTICHIMFSSGDNAVSVREWDFLQFKF